jgi:hypothetical protein
MGGSSFGSPTARPHRDPAIVLFLRKCAISRRTFLTYGHDLWITFVPGVRPPVAAAPMTLTAIAGRVISSTNAASSRTGPRRRRSGPSRWAGMIRRSPGPWRSGRSACSAAGPAQRHGGETPAAWVQASRTPLRQPPPSPQAGGPGKRGNTGSYSGNGCPGGRGSPRQQDCSIRKTAPYAKLGQRVRLPPGERITPARLCVLGGPALPQETGSLRLRPPLRDQPRQEAWHGRA